MPSPAPASPPAASVAQSDSVTDASQIPAADLQSDAQSDKRSAVAEEAVAERSGPAPATEASDVRADDSKTNDDEEEVNAKESSDKDASLHPASEEEVSDEESVVDLDSVEDTGKESSGPDVDDDVHLDLSDQDELSSLEDDALSDSDIDIDLPIQIHSRPDTPQLPLILSLPGPIIDEDTGIMDDAVERHFLNEAEELGVTVPPKPLHRPDPPMRKYSATSAASDSLGTTAIPSRTSESTRPTSRGSSVHNAKMLAKPPTTISEAPPPVPRKPSPTQKEVVPVPTLARPNRPPPSASSAKISSGEDGGSNRLVKGLKRFSSYTKRRTMMLNKTIPVSSEVSLTSASMVSDKTSSSMEAPPKSDTVELEADMPPHRPGTATTTSTLNRKLEPRSLASLHETSSYISNSSKSKSPSRTNLSESVRPEEMKDQANTEAKQRSLQNRHLQAIRLHQLGEQSQFLEYYFGVIDKVRARYAIERDAAQVELYEQKQLLEERFDEQHHEMEERHLAKEFDLRHTLDQERQACDTKLKHMDAYCNGRLEGSDENLPRRKVTDEDYRALLHQYHVRQTLGGLHESRIKVLRERQAKQLERLTDSHLAELDVIQERFDSGEEQRRAAQNNEEDKIKKEFDVKKHRLIWRWKLMETVERRKLELEMGEVYGELPEVQWGEDELIANAL